MPCRCARSPSRSCPCPFAASGAALCSVKGVMRAVLMRLKALRALAFRVPERTPRGMNTPSVRLHTTKAQR